MQKIGQKWKGLLKLLGPIFFVFILIRVVDLQTTLALLREINLQIALISILLFPVLNTVLAFRWWVICRRLELAASFGALFQVNYISWFLSALPMIGISPLSKFAYLKADGKPAGLIAISITLDKLFNIIGPIFFGLFAFVYFPRSLLKYMHLWVFYASVVVIALAVVVFGKKVWNTLKKLLSRFTSKRLHQIGRNLEIQLAKFWSNFDFKLFSLILLISIVIGLLRSLVLFLLAISLNISVSFGLIIACRALIGIVNIIPISISGLGTRDTILLLTLPLSGVSKEAAIALGFLAFLWTICHKFSGVIFWLKRPLPYHSILAVKEKLSP
jgi:uncharacterized protein (TIRG00374 family)